jgi:putative DNA methylase
VRGALPDEVTCPETGVTFSTSTGNVPKKVGTTLCGLRHGAGRPHDSEGVGQDRARRAVRDQGYSPKRDRDGKSLTAARYFLPI